MNERIWLYIRGWAFYVRAVAKSRSKKHGAGAQPWRYCHLMGLWARYIVYGQHYEGTP